MTVTKEAKPTAPDFFDLLEQAVSEPGDLAKAYKFFKQYSLSNRWLAACQLKKAGLPLEPINTFKGWLNVNRCVQKGQKAIALVMPVPIKVKRKDAETSADEDTILYTKFMLRNNWFSLSQTEGDEYVIPEATADGDDWNLSAALNFLEITEVPFKFTGVSDVRRLGCATGREISVSPLNVHPELGRVREIAKILLGHTAETLGKSVPTCSATRDLEAEATTYLVAATLGLAGLKECRGIIQANLGEDEATRLPDRCANRAFGAADKILNAGYA